MANYRSGLWRVPDHMHESVTTWIEEGQPHPSLLGSFLRAVLLHDLVQAVAHGDEENASNLRAWAMFLYNDAPEPCHGSREKLDAWHARGGLRGITGGT